MIWAFLNTFGGALKLYPFPIEDFSSALRCTEDIKLTSEIHIRLLNTILPERQKENSKVKKTVGASSWRQNLELYLREEKADFSHDDVLDVFKPDSYSLLRFNEKITILSFLVSKTLETATIRSQLEKNLSSQHELTKEWRKENRKKIDAQVGHEDAEQIKQKRDTRFERELAKVKIRTSPLGKDRYYNRYWYFGSKVGSCPFISPASTRIYIEYHPRNIKRTNDDEEKLQNGSSPKQKNKTKNNEHMEIDLHFETAFFPKDKKKGNNKFSCNKVDKYWGYYTTQEEIDQLLEFLDDRGIREKKNSSKRSKRITLRLSVYCKKTQNSRQQTQGTFRRSSRLARTEQAKQVESFRCYLNKYAD